MKINIQKVVRVFAPFIACFMLILCMAAPASAAIFDPYENGTVLVDGNLEIVTVKLNTSGMYWQRFHDGADSYNAWGTDFTYSTQMRYVDNDTVSCWPFGIMNYIDSSGIPTGSKLTVDMAVGLNVTNQSQNFECVGYLYLDTYDSRGINLSRTTVWSETQNPVIDQNVFFIEADIDTALLSGSDKWALVFSFDFNGVSNESDTTQVTLQCFGENITVQIPYSSLYQLQQQGVKTNKLLEQIDKQMAANGEKLDQIMNGSQADQDAANDFENNSSNQSDKIDDANDAMNDVAKPDINDVDTDIGAIVDVGNATVVAPFLATIVTSPHIMSMLTIMLTVSLAAYILFGKR